MQRKNEQRADESVQRIAGAGERADGGAAPERRGGGHALDIHALAQDDAAAQEADAADDVRGDARWAVGVAEQVRQRDKQSRAHRDEGGSAQTCRVLAKLPLQADHRAQDKGDSDAQREGEECPWIDPPGHPCSVRVRETRRSAWESFTVRKRNTSEILKQKR